MTTQDKVSCCCGASVYVAGNVTHYYVCEACDRPCFVVIENGKNGEMEKKVDK